MYNYMYDDDDYEFDGSGCLDGDDDYFGEMDDEFGEFDPMNEDVVREFNKQMLQTEVELAEAIAQGDLHRAERLQDEIELFLMMDT